MPIPAIALAAAPWVASIAGTLLPSIIQSFKKGKSPEEAAQLIEPHRREIEQTYLKLGMNPDIAAELSHRDVQGELQKAQLPEEMNPWMSAALSIAGGIGGFAAGKAIAGKLAGTAAATGSTGAAEAAAAKVKTPEVAPSKAVPTQATSPDDVYKAGYRDPSVDVAMTGRFDTVRGGNASGGNLPYEVKERGFQTVGPTYGSGNKGFSVEMIGDTGAARSLPAEVMSSGASLAQGGERIGQFTPIGRLGWQPVFDRSQLHGTVQLDEATIQQQLDAMFRKRFQQQMLSKNADYGRMQQAFYNG